MTILGPKSYTEQEKYFSNDYNEKKILKCKDDVILYGRNGKIIKAKTLNQRKMLSEITKNDMLFAIGPAGTGKTYTAVAIAVKALKDKKVKRIIFTRPAVEAGENIGFLPGDLKEKLDPYMQPIYDALFDMMPIAKLNDYLERENIKLEYSETKSDIKKKKLIYLKLVSKMEGHWKFTQNILKNVKILLE